MNVRRAVFRQRWAVVLWAMMLAGTASAEENFLLQLPMRDGAKLTTRVKLPGGDGPWPVLLSRTPQHNNNLNWSNFGNLWASGYVQVTQHTRGLFDSEGDDSNVLIHDGWGTHQDGLDTVLWIQEQPWCNGEVAAFGGSSKGGSVNLLAGTNPPGLKAEWLEMSMGDLYQGVLYEGGAWRRNETLEWFAQFDPGAVDLVLAHPAYDAFWMDLDINTRQHLRNHPVLMLASWYDTFLKSSLRNYRNIRSNAGAIARDGVKLVIFLRGHRNIQEYPGMPWPDSARDEPPGYHYENFINHVMRGDDNGYAALPRVCYYMMGDFLDPDAPGNEFRYADDWPPPHDTLRLYLHSDRSLGPDTPGMASPVTYVYDPADPVPTIGGATHKQPVGSWDQRPVEDRDDVILFDTPVLTEALPLAGPIRVKLSAASDATDTDFTAKLTDVYPDGQSIIISDGILRATFRNSLSAPEALVPDTIYELDIDLWDTAMVINAGHRLRLAISSSNFPRFEANPNTGAPPAVTHAETQTARNSIYLDTHHASYLELSILAEDTEGEGGTDGRHSADWRAPHGQLELSELLRVIQIFNTAKPERGAYACDPSSEDGYLPGGGDRDCTPHDSDYNPRDWRIGLSELLRLIQLFNLSSRHYHACPGESEDGFCAGAG